MKKRFVGIVLTTACVALPAWCADETKAGELGEMVTDRPDFTESSQVVGRGVVQYEMGAVYERDRGAGAKTISFGTPLMRWGMGKRWEMRVGGDGFLAQSTRGETKRGMGDTEFGIKYKLHDESKWIPAFAVIPLVGMPSGIQAFSSGKMDPGVKFTMEKDVPLGFGVSANFNAQRVTGEQDRYVQKAVTLSIGHDLPLGFGAFWEAFAFAPFDNHTGPSWIFDSGLTRGIGPDAQWDFTWGHRLNATGPDYFIQAGLTFRHKVQPFGR